MKCLKSTIRLIRLLTVSIFLAVTTAPAQTQIASGVAVQRSSGKSTPQPEHGTNSSALEFFTIDYPGSLSTQVLGINSEGTVVGAFADDNGTHGFELREGLWTVLDVPGAALTTARSINNRGEIVGFYYDADFNLHGFEWFRSKFNTIDIPFSIETRSEGINDAGVISGEYVDIDGNEHGYLLSDGHFTSFDVPNSFSSDIWMISNRDEFTGDYDNGVTVLGFLQTGHDRLLTLSFPGSADTAPRSVNDLGEVVGRWDDFSAPVQLTCTTQCHGFLWSNGTFRAIEFPGAISTVAMAINNEGWIAGRYIDASANQHGFIARPKNVK
jgi:uncharacterized membrane protein